MKYNEKQLKFIEKATELHGSNAVLDRKQVTEIAAAAGTTIPSFIWKEENRAGRGLYRVPSIDGNGSSTVPTPVETIAPVKADADSALRVELAAPITEVCVPVRDNTYVSWGHHDDIKTIIRSNRFYPIFVSGLSGNGKTVMSHQICAELGRELIRVNITAETDEDDLLGGFRLINGETVFQPGPVIEAMERGAVLLLDEIDLASYKVMCLQPVLEGNPVLLKKINKLVVPKPGFTVIACANTKGKGDDSGRFMFTNVLNEAFLERFAVTFDQPYATRAIEKKIVSKKMAELGDVDTRIVDWLVMWAESIRKAFEEEAFDEVISTRRLCHIVEANGLFNDLNKAVRLCINRFDAETQEAFMDAFTATEPRPDEPEVAETPVPEPAQEEPELDDEDYPF